MNKLLTIIRYVCAVFMILSGLIFLPSISSILFILAGILILPVKKLRELLKEKIKLSRPIKIIIVLALFIIGAMILPTNSTSSDDSIPVSTETEAATETESETETVIETEAPETEIVLQTETEKIIETEESTEAPAADSTFSVRFIDVGQADSALVECDGHYMLIDGGNKADSNLMYSVLKNAGINHLDIVVGTHAHEDHIGGLAGAFNYATADFTLCPVTYYDSDAFSDFKKYCDQNGGGITIPSVGDKYNLGSASIEILGVNGGDDSNNSSIVLKIVYGETSFLFTGDAEREAEQAILNSGADISATVLKVGHHGSDTSTTYPFLREIMPKYAVISVGADNSYGHPTDDTLSRLRDADVTVFRTDLQGDILCESDGKEVTFTTEKTADQDAIMTAGTSSSSSSGSSGSSTGSSTSSSEQKAETVSDDVQSSSGGATYILNTNTKKFHYPYCSSVDQMKDKNKQEYTGTREEVINMGYDPCKRCNP